MDYEISAPTLKRNRPRSWGPKSLFVFYPACQLTAAAGIPVGETMEGTAIRAERQWQLLKSTRPGRQSYCSVSDRTEHSAEHL